MGYPRSGLLSPTEIEIIYWVEKSLSNKEIAGLLGITLPTVKGHLRSIFSKLGAANRTEAVAKWRKPSLQVEKAQLEKMRDYYLEEMMP